MNDDWLGLNHWLSLSATCHTVRPPSSALSPVHRRIAPPKSSSAIPRCFRYQAASAALSLLLLKKTPPIPVTLAMMSSYVAGASDRTRHENARHADLDRATDSPEARLRVSCRYGGPLSSRFLSRPRTLVPERTLLP